MELGTILKELLKNSKVFLAATFLTGAAALIYQIIWQRYLHVLVGSEARSTTIIIAVFLLGLAVGYRFWGEFTEKVDERKKLLSIYGLIELLTGLYGALFPTIFKWGSLLHGNLPNSIVVDIFVCFLLIFPATFLMGATVPMLTTALPENEKGINTLHAKIYGLNTIGAFVGTLAGGFLLIFEFGLSFTSFLIGLLNIVVSFVFLLNQYDGKIAKQEAPPKIHHSLSDRFLIILVFFSGLVTIGLEIIWIRVWALTIGSSFVVFPMVLSLFVLGLGYGSYSIKEIGERALFREITKASIFLVIGHLAIPLLPLWVSHIRISFSNISSNFYVFHVVCYLFLAIFLIPLLVSLGRILPIAYALLDKGAKDYGKKCGQLYFVNTLGTFLGAIVLGYLLFYFLDLPQIIKMIILLFVLIVGWQIQNSKENKVFFVLPLLLILSVFYTWSRDSHIVGLFRSRTPVEYHFKNIFQPPSLEKYFKFKNHFFKDGPNATVSANEEFTDLGKFIAINGKSDSSTRGDYSTVNMLSIAPYLFSRGSNLKSAVVGLGTGVTAGVMTQLEGVDHVDAIEISHFVIKAQKVFAEENYNLLNNNKVTIWEQDAFKFFRNKKDNYDLVVSEPTNPWTIGVENLFTPKFYQTIARSLKRDGIFSQWFHSYAMTREIYTSIINNIHQSFKYSLIFPINGMDIIILASNAPLEFNQNFNQRYQTKTVQRIVEKMYMKDPKSFQTLVSMNQNDSDILISTVPFTLHSINFPTVGKEAYRAFFLGQEIKITTLLDPYLARVFNPRPIKRPENWGEWALEKVKKDRGFCTKTQTKQLINGSFCQKFRLFLKSWTQFNGNDYQKKLIGYSVLRKENFVPKDGKMLKSVGDYVLGQKLPPATNKDISSALIKELLKEAEFSYLDNWFNELASKKIVDVDFIEEMKGFIRVKKEIFYRSRQLINMRQKEVISPAIIFQ